MDRTLPPGVPAAEPAREEHVDDFAFLPVPEAERIDRTKVHMAGWSMVAGMVWLFYGALAATLAGTRQAMIGLVVSAVLIGAVNTAMSRLGVTTGLSSALVSRKIFGRLGEVMIAMLLAAATVYFAVFESSVVAVTFQQYWGHDLRLWYVVVVVGMVPLMMGGILSWLDRINAILLPLYGIGIVLALVMAIVKGHPAGWLDYPGVVPAAAQAIPGWLTTVVLYLGIWLVLPTTVDFARFGRRKDIRYHGLVTFGPVFSAVTLLVNGVVGMFLVQAVLPRTTAASEIGVAVALVQALGFAGVVFVVVTQVRINTLNFYQSSMNLQRLAHRIFRIRILRRPVVVVIAMVVLLLMLTDVFSYIQQALQWLGIFFVGWGGIITAHLAILGTGSVRSAPDAKLNSALLTPATVVWLVSTAVAIPLLQSKPAFPSLSQLAPLVALVAAVVGYIPVALIQRATSRTRGSIAGAAPDGGR